MSGRKQHYIPQALLRGFKAQQSGKKAQIVLYKKGRKPYISAIDSAAAERDFYSSPVMGEDALDDHITNFESTHLGEMLSQLRNAQDGQVESRLAAVLVVHLSIRSAHLRISYRALMSQMMDEMGNVLNNAEIMRSFSGIDSSVGETALISAVRESLQDKVFGFLSEKEISFIQKVAAFKLRESYDNLCERAAPLLNKLLVYSKTSMPGIVEKSQKQALQSSIAPDERVKFLEQFLWQIVGVSSNVGFILPDCIAICGRYDNLMDSQPYVIGADEKTRFVVMPLSSTQLLVGSKYEIPDLDNVNLHFARCSSEFFVASSVDEQLANMSNCIGVEVESASSNLAKDCFESYKETIARDNVGYGLEKSDLIKFDHEILAEQHLKIPLWRLISSCLTEMEIERLESVVITKDIGRGLHELTGMQVVDHYLPLIVNGHMEVVDRNGMTRCVVFIPYKLVKSLGEPNRLGEHNSSVFLIRFCLGRVVYVDRWERYFPGLIFVRNVFGLQKWKLTRLFNFGVQYFAARLASSREHQDNDVCDVTRQWVGVVDQALIAIPESIASFGEHKNADVFLLEITHHVDAILLNMAIACGVFCGRNIDSKSTALAEALARKNLLAWWLLFDRDLRSHFDLSFRWHDINELLSVASHAERLLWSFGIFFSEASGDSIQIDILRGEMQGLGNLILNTDFNL